MSRRQTTASRDDNAGTPPSDAVHAPSPPGSARERWRKSLRKLRFTRDGVFYVVFTLGVGLAALNTGNNLLFLILGLLLSVIIISGILAESALRGVSVTRRIERDPVAEEPFLVTYRLTNHKRAWPSLALTVEEVEAPILASPNPTPRPTGHRGTTRPPQASQAAIRPETGRLSQNNGEEVGQASKNSGHNIGQPSNNGLVQRPEATTTKGAKALCLHLGAASEADISVEAIAPRRGHFTPRRLRLSTSFPFGFFEKSRELDAVDDIFVLPRRCLASGEALTRLGGGGERPSARAGQGTDLFELREMTAGDDRRRIHFRKSAAVGRFLVAEREEERAPRLLLLVDNATASPEDLEQDVQSAAALLRELVASGHEVGICASGDLLLPGRGQAHLKAALRVLARLEVNPGGEAPNPSRDKVLRVATLRHSP